MEDDLHDKHGDFLLKHIKDLKMKEDFEYFIHKVDEKNLLPEELDIKKRLNEIY